MYLSSISSRLLLYDVNSWDLKKSYGCYDGLLRDITWSDDSKYILQVNSKGIVEILSPADHNVRTLQHVPIKDSWSACFHRDGHRNIAIGTKNGHVMIWDTKNKSITKTFPAPSQQYTVNFISYNAKNTSLAATMHNGDTVIYGLVSNIPILTVKLACSRSISAMKFHPESRYSLGLATDEGHVVIRDISTNKDRVFFENIHASPVSDITYSLVNRDVMLSTGLDKVMQIYDTRLQNVVSTVKTQYTLSCVAINTENQVALGTKTGAVLVYDLRDLKTPTKILGGHDEEVSKVAFQPIRKKSASAEISLREDAMADYTPVKISSPVRTRTSDMFYITSTPPQPQKDNIEITQPSEDTKADSFLVMMGLDRSNTECLDDFNKTDEKKSDVHEVKNSHLEIEKNISKVSTPLSHRVGENFVFPSPISCAVFNEGKQSNGIQRKEEVDTKCVEELKEFVKMTMADVAEDSRNYFLHIMMSLTKQKLFMEKQICTMNDQIGCLISNQNALLEANKKLVYEIGQLKCRLKNYDC